MLAAALTANSLVSTVPITLRGSSRPSASSAGRGDRSPTAAAGGVDEARRTSPSGARNLMVERLLEHAA